MTSHPAIHDINAQEVNEASPGLKPQPAGKPVRVYIDGCFDLMHSGHYNAIRQARALGDILVVGVHNDAEITRNKGPPVMREQERYKLVEACKWVDEVVPDVPYTVTLELLDRLNCDFVVHGDDLATNSDGQDAYHEVKAAGRMRTVKRTEGVSTTDLVGRLLLMTKAHLNEPTTAEGSRRLSAGSEAELQSVVPASQASGDVAAPVSQFLPTTRRIIQFANGFAPKPTDRVVYIDGAWDLFHIGHLDTLQKAKALGSFLVVGVHDDTTVNAHKGRNYPVMNLHERVLNVLACRFVDEVIIGAPWLLTRDLITSMNISVVVQGTSTRSQDYMLRGEDPYAVAKQMGVYHEVASATDMSTEDIVERIIENRLRFLKRNESKAAKERSYIQDKQFVQEI